MKSSGASKALCLRDVAGCLAGGTYQAIRFPMDYVTTQGRRVMRAVETATSIHPGAGSQGGVLFRGHFDPTSGREFPDSDIGKYFSIDTGKEEPRGPSDDNLNVLHNLESEAGFRYFPGQLGYISEIIGMDHALVAADVGAGKTLVAASIISARRPRRVIVIAPQGVVRNGRGGGGQWQSELRRFAPRFQVFNLFGHGDVDEIERMGPPPDGVYVSYYEAAFLNGGGISDRISSWFDMAILDEAHLCANHESKRGAGIFRIQPKLRYALTATPIFDRADDLFSIMGWLGVDGWADGFRRSDDWPYAACDEKRFREDFLSRRIDLGRMAFSARISCPDVLVEQASKMSRGLSKEACRPDYVRPPVTVYKVPVGECQGAALKDLYAARRRRHGWVSASSIDSKIRTVCCSGAGRCSPKTMMTVELIARAITSGESIVIINSRISATDQIAYIMADASIPVSRIDTTVPARLHGEEARKFKAGETKVILMGIRCAQGYSFDRCRNLVIQSLDWTSGSLEQALGRIDRITSKRVPSLSILVCAGTIEEDMLGRVAEKADANSILLTGAPGRIRFVDGKIEDIADRGTLQLESDGMISEDVCQARVDEIVDFLLASGK